MASSEQIEESVEILTIDKMGATIEELKVDEKETLVTSSVGECDKSNVSANIEEKTDPTSNVTNESLDTEKKEEDNAKDESKHNVKSLITVKNEQNGSEAKDKENQDMKQETKQKTRKQTMLETASFSQNVNEGKDLNNEDDQNFVKEGYVLKRKRKTLNLDMRRNVNASSSPKQEISLMEEGAMRNKRKKLKTLNDKFCWRCHKESVDVPCTACPRAWHRRCIGGAPPSLEKWICGECATILRAENAETRSIAMAQLSVDQLCMLLKHVVELLREHTGSEPFCKPVNIVEVSNYLDYVIKPMDLSLLESNVRAKLYGSTDAFMADAKWIQHNCIVFNTCGGVYTDTSKLTNAAKQLIKVARQEVSEIEACPDCYSHGRNLPRPQPSWFIEPCRRPHPLVWAKLKGFPFWPAKAMPRLNSQGYVDVRFFGEHDRAWVSPKDLYLYSKEPPAPSSRKRKSDMDECVREITRHCRKLELMFGEFKFAPPKVQYNPNDPMQITLILPKYNPLGPNHPNPESFTSKKKTPLRKRSLLIKDKSQNNGESIMDNEETNVSKKNINQNSTNKNNHKNESDSVPIKTSRSNLDIKNTLNSQSLNDSHNKASNSRSEEVVIIAQTKRDERKNVKILTIKDSGAEDSKTQSPNFPNKNNLLQANDGKVKSVSENLPKLPTSSIREQPDMAKAQKKNSFKNINPRRKISQIVSENVLKSTLKDTKSGKIYKPKTRMVDKLNAEKALKYVSASKENNKLTTASGLTKRVSLLSNNTKDSMNAKKIPEIDITLSPTLKFSSKAEGHTVSSTNIHTPADKSILLFASNNETTAEAAKQQQQTASTDYQGNRDAPTVIQREVKESRDSPFQKKESKAKKSFPNKLRGVSHINHLLPTNISNSPTQVSSFKSDISSNYQLLPPEAGPISARLHHSAQELARRMGQLMEEAYKEAAQADGNGENGTADNYQATIFFLRMQIEHMKWQHQQQIAELKHNSDRTMREMRASLEVEKLRLVEEIRHELEEEKVRCIEEVKHKQWCAKCGKEALFYCCWNTAYCDYPCQQAHWSQHMRTCSQQPIFTTMVTTSSVKNANLQSQSMPKLVFNANSDIWKS